MGFFGLSIFYDIKTLTDAGLQREERICRILCILAWIRAYFYVSSQFYVWRYYMLLLSCYYSLCNVTRSYARI